VVDILWDHRILTVCMRRSEEDGVDGAQNGMHILSKTVRSLTSGLLCHSSGAVSLQELLPHTFRSHVATPRFVIHAACVHSLVLLVFKVLSHICQMSSSRASWCRENNGNILTYYLSSTQVVLSNHFFWSAGQTYDCRYIAGFWDAIKPV